MKKKLGTIMALSLSIILLVVSVSFSWMLMVDPNFYHNLLIDYTSESENSLVIAPQELEITVLMQGDDGSFDETDSEILLSDLVPGNTISFRIRIKNKSENKMSINLSLANVLGDIVSERTENSTGTLLDALFVSIRGGVGYNDNSNITSPYVYKRLNNGAQYNAVSDTYFIPLINYVDVPSAKDEEYVEFNCYFYFDVEAGLEYQAKKLTIGTFRVEQ